VFRIVDDRAASNHETLPRNRFLLHCDPFEPQWAVTPKLTMIAGAGNFPSGRFRCETPFLDLNVACDF